MKRTLSLVLALVMVLGSFSFTFAAETNVVAEAGQFLKDNGVLEGNDAGDLMLESDLKRQDAVVLLSRLMKEEDDAKAFDASDLTFTDITNNFYKGYLAWSVSNGLVKGHSTTRFGFNEDLTAQQFATILLRALGQTDVDYAKALETAKGLGLLANVNAENSTVVTRGMMAVMTLNTLGAEVEGTEGTLADKLGIQLPVVEEPVPATLEVKSVSAVNAKQLQVVFNREVNETSAETIGNYFTVNSTGVETAMVGTAELQADNKTVVITLTAALVNNAVYGVRVKNVIDTTVQTVKPYTTTFIANDKIAPTLNSVTSTAKISTNAITLTFSEPVDITSAAVTVNGQFASLAHVAGSNETMVTVTSGTSLMAGTTYNLNIMNFKDWAGNFTANNPLTSTVTVAADTVAPTVTNVVINGDNELEVTFDKSMNIATLVQQVSVRLLDNNLLSTAGTLGAPAAKAGTNNKTFTFAITGTTWPTTNVKSAVVAFNDTITDLVGNQLVAATRSVTFTKDIAAPALVNGEYKNTSTYGVQAGAPFATPNGSIVFTFNEPITARVAPTTVINNLGAAVEAPFGAPVVNQLNTRELIVPLSAPVATGTTSYLILLPSGMVTDRAQTPNNSIAVNYTVNVTAGAVVVGDVVAPVLSGVSATLANLTNPTVISLSYTEAGSGLDLNTVVNINNYRLDGLPLPTGSYVTVTGANTTTVTIPVGSITEDKTSTHGAGGYVFTVSGVKDKAGNVMTTNVSNITLLADAKPVLNSGTINANGTLSVGFSLPVKSVSNITDSANSLTVTVNGVAKSFSTVAGNDVFTITDGVGSDSGKYVITVYDNAGNVYNVNNAATISVATSANPTEIQANTTLGASAKASTVVVVR